MPQHTPEEQARLEAERRNRPVRSQNPNQNRQLRALEKQEEEDRRIAGQFQDDRTAPSR